MIFTTDNLCSKCGRPFQQPNEEFIIGEKVILPLCEGHPSSTSSSLPLFPSGTFGYYEIAYVAELQKARDELVKEREGLCNHWEKTIREREELKNECTRLKFDLERRDRGECPHCNELFRENKKLKAEQDELKDKIDRLNRMAASDPNWIYCLRGFVDGLKTNLEMMTNEREEARHWARKYYKWARCYYELLCERDKLNREKTGNAIANLEDVIENQSEFYGLGFSEREFLECITERINLVIASLKKDVDIESCDRKTMDNTSEHWLPQGRGG